MKIPLVAHTFAINYKQPDLTTHIKFLFIFFNKTHEGAKLVQHYNTKHHFPLMKKMANYIFDSSLKAR